MNFAKFIPIVLLILICGCKSTAQVSDGGGGSEGFPPWTNCEGDVKAKIEISNIRGNDGVFQNKKTNKESKVKINAQNSKIEKVLIFKYQDTRSNERKIKREVIKIDK